MMPQALIQFLERGGPTLWLIAGLSVVMLALILWKIWRLARMGAWSGAATKRAVALWAQGDRDGAGSAALWGEPSGGARADATADG